MLQNAIRVSFFSFFLITNFAFAQTKSFDVSGFDSVVVSPHISVTFKQGDKESVVVESITEPMEKFNLEVKNNTLSLFLKDARITTKNKKEKTEHYTRSNPIYKGTVAVLTVTYKNINDLDLRGEEKFLFESTIDTESLRLKIFGESEVVMNNVSLRSLQATLYGESNLEILRGDVGKQKITAYGETTVNTQNVESKETKLTAYGSGTFQLNVADRLKITSFGEATIVYKGNPDVDRGIVIGETSIVRKSGK